MGRFIQIAMGSASEVAYLILAKDLEYLWPQDHASLAQEVDEIRRMLTVFYKRIRTPQKLKLHVFANS